MNPITDASTEEELRKRIEWLERHYEQERLAFRRVQEELFVVQEEKTKLQIEVNVKQGECDVLRRQLEVQRDTYARELTERDRRIIELLRQSAISPVVVSAPPPAATSRALPSLVVVPLAAEESNQRTKVEDEEAHSRSGLWTTIDTISNAATLEYLSKRYLHHPTPTLQDSFAIGEGLYNLWRNPVTASCIASGMLDRLLASEATRVTALWFNICETQPIWYGKHYALPVKDVRGFVPDVLCRLPALRVLAIGPLPDTRSFIVPWVARLPASMRELVIANKYQFSDLQQIIALAPQLTQVSVRARDCIQWGQCARISSSSSTQQYMKTARDMTRNIVHFID